MTKIAAKSTSKTKPAAKPVAKKAASSAAAKARPAAKAAPKPAAKAGSKPAAKAAPARKPVKPAEKPAPKTAPVKKTASHPVEKPAAKTAIHPPAAKPSHPGTTRPGKSVAKTAPAPIARPAEKYSPPGIASRIMNPVVVDLPKPAAKADPKLANAWKSKQGRELTDAEVLAMPDAEYMGEKQLEFFRNKLMQQKNDLLDNAGETTEHLREDTSIVPDPADRATIEEEHALELRTRDRERKLLKKISQAIARIDSGEYGYCDETGEPIGLGRLIARPTATLSLEAQQRREMKQKMFGD